MAKQITITPNKTYATEANAIKAVEKVIPPEVLPKIRYFIMIGADGRFFPVFIGIECMTHGIHFHFNIIG